MASREADFRPEENTKAINAAQEAVHDNSEDDEHVDTTVQPGIQDIEAVTITWSKTWLIIAYILIWLTYFVQGLVSGVSGSLLPFVTSDFALHSLTPTTSILSSVIGGVTNLSIAKVLDIFGRPQGFLLCVVLCVLGLIMSASCNNVEAYAASQRDNGGHTPWQSVTYYCHEFDAVGLILVSAGVAFFLLPFNLYTIQAKGWGSSLIICFLVFGIVLIIAFAIWERFFARVSFIPWRLLKDRTVLGACLLSFTLFISYACWASYFTSFLQVVNNLTITNASYVMQTYTVGGVIFSLITGSVISYTGRYKPIALYFGVPLTVLGMGLLIYFRQPDQNIGYIVMCMIFLSFAEGVLVICDEIAIMAAAAEQQYFAVSLAVLGLFGNIGSAIGLTISAAIWQGILPKKLAEYLPAVDQENLLLIYESLPTQLAFPVGSPERLAIQHAYGDAQRGLLIAGTAVWAIGILAVLMLRDIKVIGIKQTKGQVA
ncbi:hypothetical protein OIDMADRAFT_136373 [Oidiodendron maius Zn]|uniref:Major facilitator superfamily (MFS) profile domain-containing protein n=1 Tax=Oidiodendron maius (strain Zn) TaxID=913774 RepID=A0A0C3GD45_OIDMZ|nr:hypothetical protein OIDMADRAFT_136373 [Oidiodendron maius Zn]